MCVPHVYTQETQENWAKSLEMTQTNTLNIISSWKEPKKLGEGRLWDR